MIAKADHGRAIIVIMAAAIVATLVMGGGCRALLALGAGAALAAGLLLALFAHRGRGRRRGCCNFGQGRNGSAGLSLGARASIGATVA